MGRMGKRWKMFEFDRRAAFCGSEWEERKRDDHPCIIYIYIYDIELTCYENIII